MSPDLKRRAVYRALSEYFEGDELLEIMLIWEDQFAARPQFVLNEFISIFFDRIAARAPRSTLFKALTSHLMDPAAAHWPDPTPALQQFRARQQEQHQRLRTSGTFTALKAVLDALNQELPAATQRQLQAYVLQQLRRARLDDGQRRELEQWLQGGSGVAIAELQLETAKAVLHYAYIALCEYLGPVEADRLLSHGIDRADRQLQGRGISASRLL